MLLEERNDLIEIVRSDHLNDVKNLERFIKRNPNDAEAHCVLGTSYLYKNRRKAVEEFEKAIGLKLNLADAYFYLGEVDYLNSRYSKNKEKLIEKAVKNYEKAIAIEPSFKIANYKLGRIHFENKDFDRAIERFEAIIPSIEKLSKRDKIIHSFFWFNTTIYPENGRNIQLGIKLKKEDSQDYRSVYHFLALSYKNKGIMNKAKELAKKKIELSFCTKKEAIFYLGCVHYEFEDYEEAIKEWEKINPIEKKIELDVLGKGCPIDIDLNWIEDKVIREIYELDDINVICKNKLDNWDFRVNLKTCINDAKKRLKTKNNSF